MLDWHLRRELKTALLDVGKVVPNILMQFLADWREAELLWIFQVKMLSLLNHDPFLLLLLLPAVGDDAHLAPYHSLCCCQYVLYHQICSRLVLQ